MIKIFSPLGDLAKRDNLLKKEQGVTLVVAIVLLAAITFISFSISTIVIREIVAARLTLKSEPAISAANSGGEVGLYRLFRETGGVAVSGSLAQSGVTFQVTPDLYDDFYAFTAPAGQETRVLLYDAENINNPAADFGSAAIQMDPGSGIATYRITDWTNVETTLYSGTLGAGGTTGELSLNSSDDRYIIYILAGSAVVSGKVTATNTAGAPRGIPSDNPKLNVKGTNGPVQRRIEITL